MKHAPDARPKPWRPHTITTISIPLGDSDYEAIADHADAELLAGFFWRPQLHFTGTVYAVAWRRHFQVAMHRLILGAGPAEQVDHINLNGLDNRQANLRVATSSQNHANRSKLVKRTGRGGFTSPYKGVYWDSTRRRWMAHITVDGKKRSIGRYTDETAAARAYDTAAIQAWGEFARVNFPDET